MQFDSASLIEPVVAIARDAGRRILAVYQSEFTVDRKDDHSPLTAADRAAHEVIAEGLARLTPDVPLWSEESAASELTGRAAWSSFWLVDPLDGTREFIKRNGEFTVNIALVRGHDAILGVVHVPVLGRDYFGTREGGAFRRDGGEPARAISVRRPARDPVRVVGSRSYRNSELDEFLRRLGPHDVVPVGSSLKFCLVAEGAADVYPRLGPTSEWDTAAAQAVLEAAGGRVTDVDGRPLSYNRGEGVLNPWFLAYGDPDRDWTSYVRRAGP